MFNFGALCLLLWWSSAASEKLTRLVQLTFLLKIQHYKQEFLKCECVVKQPHACIDPTADMSRHLFMIAHVCNKDQVMFHNCPHGRMRMAEVKGQRG